MCKIMAEMREEYYQRGIDQNRIDNIHGLMQTMKLTAQQAMDALMIPKSEQQKYFAML